MTTKQTTTLAGIGAYSWGGKKEEKHPARTIRTLEILNYGDGVSLALGYEPRKRTASCIVAIVDGIAYSISTNIKDDTQTKLEELAKKNNITPEALIRTRVEELTAKGLINL